jgi:VWFA-related protein
MPRYSDSQVFSVDLRFGSSQTWSGLHQRELEEQASMRKGGVLVIVVSLVIIASSAVSLGQQNAPSNQPIPQTSQPEAAPDPMGLPPRTKLPPPPAQDEKNPTADPSAQPSPITPESSSGDQGMFVFKKQVQEVVLHATVVDDKQRLAAHLDRGAFTVFEDGQLQTITSFRREDVPVAIGIVIDNSSSMRAKRQQLNEAVLNLVRASNPLDQVFVVNFSQSPYLDQDFTSNIGLLENALHRTTMQGTTALYDAVVAAAMHIEQGTPLQKKILLVITDGKDNMSRATLPEAMRRLQGKNGPVVYAIGLMGTQPNSGREALERLAQATGGSAFFPDSLDDVGAITVALAHDIRSQYTIAFKPADEKSNVAFHPIEVEARAPGYGKLTVRTRNGYYAGETVQ